jgi:hypothetical protein
VTTTVVIAARDKTRHHYAGRTLTFREDDECGPSVTSASSPTNVANTPNLGVKGGPATVTANDQNVDILSLPPPPSQEAVFTKVHEIRLENGFCAPNATANATCNRRVLFFFPPFNETDSAPVNELSASKNITANDTQTGPNLTGSAPFTENSTSPLSFANVTFPLASTSATSNDTQTTPTSTASTSIAENSSSDVTTSNDTIQLVSTSTTLTVTQTTPTLPSTSITENSASDITTSITTSEDTIPSASAPTPIPLTIDSSNSAVPDNSTTNKMRFKRFPVSPEYVTFVKVYKRGNVCSASDSPSSPSESSNQEAQLLPSPSQENTAVANSVLGLFSPQTTDAQESVTVTIDNSDGAPISTQLVNPNPTSIRRQELVTATLHNSDGAPISTQVVNPNPTSISGPELVAVTLYNSDGAPISTQLVNPNPTYITYYNAANEPTSTATLDQFVSVIEINSESEPVSTYVLYDPLTTQTEFNSAGLPTATSVGNIPLSTITYYNWASQIVSLRVVVSGQPTAAVESSTSTSTLTVQLDSTPTSSSSSSAGHRVSLPSIMPLFAWSIACLFIIPGSILFLS